jgi:hypothetical protein
MGQLTGEVLWLVNNFWKGLHARIKVPCLPPCPNSGTGLFDVEALRLAKEEGHPKFPCPVCNKWQSVDSLRLGIVLQEASWGRLEEQLRQVESRLAPQVTQGFEAVLSQADELFVAHLRMLDDEAEKGPRLFTLVPVDARWTRPGLVKQRFRLTLYCEHSRLPLNVLSGNPDTGVYELEMPRAWVVKAAPALKVAATLLSVALPAARALAHVDLGDTAWRKVEAQLDAAKEGADSLVHELAKDLGEAAGGEEEGREAVMKTDIASRSLDSVLRELHDILDKRDPTFGGLAKVRNNRREPLWVHPRFVEIYRPPPPFIPGSPELEVGPRILPRGMQLLEP